MTHLDLDAIADLQVGEGSARDQEHLRSCASCTELLADLQAAQAPVLGGLSALPPLVIPAPVAARLSVGDRSGAGRPPAADVLPLAPVRRAEGDRPHLRRRPRRLAPVAGVAAAVVLVAGGVAVLTRSSRNPSASSTATSAGSVAAPQVRRFSTGTNYTPTTLAGALPHLLRGTPPGPGPAADRRTGVVGLSRLQGTAALAACLSALTPPDQPGLPLAVDDARYAGRPALVVILASAKAGKLDVYVVGPRCAAADADVVFFTRLARP